MIVGQTRVVVARSAALCRQQPRRACRNNPMRRRRFAHRRTERALRLVAPEPVLPVGTHASHLAAGRRGRRCGHPDLRFEAKEPAKQGDDDNKVNQQFLQRAFSLYVCRVACVCSELSYFEFFFFFRYSRFFFSLAKSSTAASVSSFGQTFCPSPTMEAQGQSVLYSSSKTMV